MILIPSPARIFPGSLLPPPAQPAAGQRPAVGRRLGGTAGDDGRSPLLASSGSLRVPCWTPGFLRPQECSSNSGWSPVPASSGRASVRSPSSTRWHRCPLPPDSPVRSLAAPCCFSPQAAGNVPALAQTIKPGPQAAPPSPKLSSSQFHRPSSRSPFSPTVEMSLGGQTPVPNSSSFFRLGQASVLHVLKYRGHVSRVSRGPVSSHDASVGRTHLTLLPAEGWAGPTPTGSPRRSRLLPVSSAHLMLSFALPSNIPERVSGVKRHALSLHWPLGPGRPRSCRAAEARWRDT